MDMCGNNKTQKQTVVCIDKIKMASEHELDGIDMDADIPNVSHKGKTIRSYTASFKLKVIVHAERFSIEEWLLDGSKIAIKSRLKQLKSMEKKRSDLLEEEGNH